MRPSSITRKFVGNDVDPAQVGKEVHVATVLTGHFLKQGDKLLVTLEAIDVDTNRLKWQSNVTVPADDLIALQAGMAAQVRQGLLPNLGAGGGVLDTQTRPKDAQAYDLYLRALAIGERAFGPEHPGLIAFLNNLGVVFFDDRDWAQAVEYLQRSASIAIKRTQRQASMSVGQPLTSRVTTDTSRARFALLSLTRALYQLSRVDGNRSVEQAQQAFQAAQWALETEAAASLAQMAARQSKGEDAIAKLVRERQDLAAEWQTHDKALLTAVSRAPDKRDIEAEKAVRARLVAIDRRIAEIDGGIANDFADYAALSNPAALDIATTRQQLRANEALVLLLDTPELGQLPGETFVWVVTTSQARLTRVPMGTQALTDRVAALRCGLDQASWENDGVKRCGTLLNSAFTAEDAQTGKPLPFDLGQAHELYRALFSQIEDLIEGKDLLVVPSGPLTSLPFQVLVTEKPASADYRDAAWLVRRHAITILPSVSGLRGLRQFAKPSQATQPFIGFGNPLLLGPNGNDRRAWERQACTPSSGAVQIATRRVRSALPKFFRSGGLANVEEVRAQYPLPETSDELCAVAQSSGAGESAVYLGLKASEANIKVLSTRGILAQARVVHFATHGLLAGETEMLAAARAEPALILTPPEKATEDDDGLLTASEIALLKLDADWVVLSACNTAAGDKPGAKSLNECSILPLVAHS
jgi:hypothetical protein